MNRGDQPLLDEVRRAIAGLVQRLPELGSAGFGIDGEVAARLGALRLPVALELALLQEWPRASCEAWEFTWSIDADVQWFQGWYAREIEMLPVARCLDGDIVAVDCSQPGFPVYVLEMVTLVDASRTAEQPFCIRLADTLPAFLDWVAADGSWERRSMGALDFYSLSEFAGRGFPPPEARPAARQLHPDSGV